MATIWCCEASVTVKEPMTAPGYAGKTTISVPVKVRTESEVEPPDSAIIEEARQLMDACYDAEVISIQNPITNFLLWRL